MVNSSKPSHRIQFWVVLSLNFIFSYRILTNAFKEKKQMYITALVFEMHTRKSLRQLAHMSNRSTEVEISFV